MHEVVFGKVNGRWVSVGVYVCVVACILLYIHTYKHMLSCIHTYTHKSMLIHTHPPSYTHPPHTHTPTQVQFTLDSLRDPPMSTAQQAAAALEAMARLCWSDDDARQDVGEQGGRVVGGVVCLLCVALYLVLMCLLCVALCGVPSFCCCTCSRIYHMLCT